MHSVNGQDWGRYWCFGDSAGIDFSNPAVPTPFESYMDNAWSCASIGDSAHGLFFYAHSFYWPRWLQGTLLTTAVHNKYHSLMDNGDSLIGDMHDGMTIFPKPNSQNLFYLIQITFSTYAGVYYSIIDPYYNLDTGIVIQKNIKLTLSDNKIQGGINAVRHGNGRDWWLICRNWDNSNRWNSFLFTPDSIIGPFEYNVGTNGNSDGGSISISKAGDKIALASYSGFIETYNFDRCSGVISTPVKITLPIPNPYYFGCEFSPNGSLLYVSVTDNIFGDSLRLYQFDITNSNPGSTVQKLYCEKVPASGGMLKRGPDDKIYFTCLYEYGWRYADTCRNIYNENLGVINNPDIYGTGCNFSPFSFYLGGKRTYWNLPNNPNFLLGPMYGSACDSLSTGIDPVAVKQSIAIFPNPCNDILSAVGNIPSNSDFKIFDYEGSLLKEGKTKNLFLSIDVSGFVNGVYYLSINSTLFRKFIVMH